MKSYTTLRNQFGNLAKNNNPTTLAIGDQLINDSLRYLTTKFYFNERQFTTTTTAQQQFYNAPPLLKNIIDVTVNVGGVIWTPKFAPNRQYWDYLNNIVFFQDYPQFFYLYGNQIGLFPIPATTGNPLVINYQTRIADLTQADYVTGTVSVTAGATTVTGSGTSWTTSMAGRWIQLTENNTSNSTSGDSNWYQIFSVTNSTTMTLFGPYQGSTVSGGSYIIGEMPILAEDHQDLALYRALWIYYTSRVPDATRAALYKDLYDTGFEILNAEFGQKTTNVVLTDTDTPIYNPNLFISSITGQN